MTNAKKMAKLDGCRLEDISDASVRKSAKAELENLLRSYRDNVIRAIIRNIAFGATEYRHCESTKDVDDDEHIAEYGEKASKQYDSLSAEVAQMGVFDCAGRVNQKTLRNLIIGELLN
jgi:hypothetical protein